MHGLEGSIAFLEAKGLAVVFEAYAYDCAGEEITEVGFNPNSGYVYIALENGISIASFMGQRVQFLVTDFENGEEFFFDNYRLATTQNESLYN
jgi:hypothetical protein